VPHDGYVIAVHEDEYMGISEFGISPTTTAPDWANRGTDS
jgi:hypothetical protein